MWNLVIIMAAFTHSGVHKPEMLWYSPSMTVIGTYLGAADKACMAAGEEFEKSSKLKMPGVITGTGGDDINDIRMMPQCIKVDLLANVAQKSTPQ